MAAEEQVRTLIVCLPFAQSHHCFLRKHLFFTACLVSLAQRDGPCVLVVANRLPMSLKKEKSGEWTFKMSSGGLVSALMGVKGLRMKWIGWPGAEIAEKDQPIITKEILKQNCVPVFISEKMADLYYTG